MNKFTVKGFLFSLIFGLSFVANATLVSLVENGDFEDVDVQDGSWQWFAAGAVGWSGDNVEIWDSLFPGVEAFSGEQHAELNAHPYNGTQWVLEQTLTGLTDGDIYDFGFAYRARSNTSESFRFEIIGSESSVNLLLDDHTTTQWEQVNSSFKVVGTEATIRFSSIQPGSGTVGNLLDAVYVNASEGGSGTSQPVPEPSTLLIFSLALIGLNWRRVSASLQRK
ncbi:PEP-CTERM sorting domain-containing protein [Thalassotalea crassostreae]|uniref:PEP-CTERM sorting domain-containing protein n=1 Tax=Thalassotalea crassostreae TaxID=1763536 RepID=UPI0008381DD3|nr:PEP-CTERM sorting domain-containing protein [Thalassotalea crassostreae]